MLIDQLIGLRTNSKLIPEGHFTLLKCEKTKHRICRMNGGKDKKASRLGGLERVRGGEK